MSITFFVVSKLIQKVFKISFILEFHLFIMAKNKCSSVINSSLFFSAST